MNSSLSRDIRLFLRRLRGQFGIQEGPPHHIDDVEAGQHKSGDQRPGVQPHHGNARHGPVDDQHDARRDQDTEATAGTDDAGGQLFVVAGFQQGRKGQQSHQRHHGADDTDGGGKDRAGHQRRHGHGAGHNAGGDVQAVKQPLARCWHVRRYSP